MKRSVIDFSSRNGCRLHRNPFVRDEIAFDRVNEIVRVRVIHVPIEKMPCLVELRDVYALLALSASGMEGWVDSFRDIVD